MQKLWFVFPLVHRAMRTTLIAAVDGKPHSGNQLTASSQVYDYRGRPVSMHISSRSIGSNSRGKRITWVQENTGQTTYQAGNRTRNHHIRNSIDRHPPNARNKVVLERIPIETHNTMCRMYASRLRLGRLCLQPQRQMRFVLGVSVVPVFGKVYLILAKSLVSNMIKQETLESVELEPRTKQLCWRFWCRHTNEAWTPN